MNRNDFSEITDLVFHPQSRAAMFKALGEPTRLRIFEFLRSCRCSVSVEDSGEVRPVTGPTVGEVCCRITGADKINSTISEHLKELRVAGLITIERRGRTMVCGVNNEAIKHLGGYFDENSATDVSYGFCDDQTCSTTWKKQTVLILCTGNSARSQMAEGLLRHDSGGTFDVESAGTAPTVVRPEAITAMQEIGIDISGHRSKNVLEFKDIQFDYVITVCDNARENCPVFFGAQHRLHHSFDDPAALDGNEEERLAAFRRVRDDLRLWLGEFASNPPK